jgi:hypothetical protein
MTADFKEILTQLGIDLDLFLTPENDKICTLKIDDKLIMQLELDESESNILIGTFLCDLPPGKFRENVFINTLKANGQIPLTGTFAFNEPSAKLAFFQYISLESVNLASLKKYLEHFIEKAMKWKEAIESGQSAPLAFEREIEQSKPSIFTPRL